MAIYIYIYIERERERERERSVNVCYEVQRLVDNRIFLAAHMETKWCKWVVTTRFLKSTIYRNSNLNLRKQGQK